MKFYDRYNWDALYEEYKQGKTMEDLVYDHGLNKWIVWKYFKKMGYKLRQPGSRQCPLTINQ